MYSGYIIVGGLLENWLAKVRFMSLMCKLSALSKYRQEHVQTLVHFKRQWSAFYHYYSKVKSDFVLSAHVLELL